MSEKNKNRASKKWLISRMKTSGSKRRYLGSHDYSDTRNAKKEQALEFLPSHESMSKPFEFYNGKINTDLLKRFLATQIGNPWDEVYAEIIARFPNKLLHYKDCIHWYVADKVEFRAGEMWNLRNQHFIQTNTEDTFKFKKNYRFLPFYVDPNTQQLQKIGTFQSKKASRNFSKEELRKYREAQQKDKRNLKKEKKNKSRETIEKIQFLLHQNNTSQKKPTIVKNVKAT